MEGGAGGIGGQRGASLGQNVRAPIQRQQHALEPQERGDVARSTTEHLPIGVGRRLVVPPALELEGARHGPLLGDGRRRSGDDDQECEDAGAEGECHSYLVGDSDSRRK